jgi:hypothetical protein
MPRPTYADSVFVNIPFDEDYEPILEALLFAIHDCGFVARSALELDDSSQIRLSKLYDIMAESGLGIHDLSRTELDARYGLPRFNMPLELGVFLGAKEFGSGRQKNKRSLILDRQRFRFQKFCSDIAGQDIKAHDNKPSRAVAAIRDWLASARAGSGIQIPSASRINTRYRTFRRKLPALCTAANQELAELTYSDYVTLVVGWLEENHW